MSFFMYQKISWIPYNLNKAKLKKINRTFELKFVKKNALAEKRHIYRCKTPKIYIKPKRCAIKFCIHKKLYGWIVSYF